MPSLLSGPGFTLHAIHGEGWPHVQPLWGTSLQIAVSASRRKQSLKRIAIRDIQHMLGGDTAVGGAAHLSPPEKNLRFMLSHQG